MFKEDFSIPSLCFLLSFENCSYAKRGKKAIGHIVKLIFWALFWFWYF